MVRQLRLIQTPPMKALDPMGKTSAAFWSLLKPLPEHTVLPFLRPGEFCRSCFHALVAQKTTGCICFSRGHATKESMSTNLNKWSVQTFGLASRSEKKTARTWKNPITSSTRRKSAKVPGAALPARPSTRSLHHLAGWSTETARTRGTKVRVGCSRVAIEPVPKRLRMSISQRQIFCWTHVRRRAWRRRLGIPHVQIRWKLATVGTMDFHITFFLQRCPLQVVGFVQLSSYIFLAAVAILSQAEIPSLL